MHRDDTQKNTYEFFLMQPLSILSNIPLPGNGKAI